MNPTSPATAKTSSSASTTTTTTTTSPSPAARHQAAGGATDASVPSTTSPPAVKTPGSGPAPSPSRSWGDAEEEEASPRVVYGPGAVARLPAELARLHLTSPLIVSSPSRIALARRIQALIPSLDSRILDSAIVSVPARVVDGTLDRMAGRDVVVSIGGASAVGLAKAISQRKGIPHVCIPTTYSGSEMMPLLLDASPARHGKGHRHRRGSSGRRLSGTRSTIRDPSTTPTVVIYDEELTTSVPKRFPAPSDAVAMTQPADLCGSNGEEDTTQWSYIHLPGV